MSDEYNLCDNCGEEMGARGWMLATGRTARLPGGERDLPIYVFFCNEECLREWREDHPATGNPAAVAREHVSTSEEIEHG